MEGWSEGLSRARGSDHIFLRKPRPIYLGLCARSTADQAVVNLFRESCKKEKVAVQAQLKILVEQYLIERGLWGAAEERGDLI